MRGAINEVSRLDHQECFSVCEPVLRQIRKLKNVGSTLRQSSCPKKKNGGLNQPTSIPKMIFATIIRLDSPWAFKVDRIQENSAVQIVSALNNPPYSVFSDQIQASRFILFSALVMESIWGKNDVL